MLHTPLSIKNENLNLCLQGIRSELPAAVRLEGPGTISNPGRLLSLAERLSGHFDDLKSLTWNARRDVLVNAQALIHLLRSGCNFDDERQSATAADVLGGLRKVVWHVECLNELHILSLRHAIQAGRMTGEILRTVLVDEIGQAPSLYFTGMSPADLLFDKMYRIGKERTKGDWFCKHTPVLQSIAMADALDLGPGDTLADLGSDLGYVGILVSQLKGIHCINIEHDPKIHQMATEIAERNKLRNHECVNANVLDFDFGRANVFYMFNPFESRETDEAVVEKLKQRAALGSIMICCQGGIADTVAASTAFCELGDPQSAHYMVRRFMSF